MKEWLPVFKERIAYKKSLYEANSLWHGALYKFSIANMVSFVIALISCQR